MIGVSADSYSPVVLYLFQKSWDLEHLNNQGSSECDPTWQNIAGMFISHMHFPIEWQRPSS